MEVTGRKVDGLFEDKLMGLHLTGIRLSSSFLENHHGRRNNMHLSKPVYLIPPDPEQNLLKSVFKGLFSLMWQAALKLCRESLICFPVCCVQQKAGNDSPARSQFGHFGKRVCKLGFALSVALLGFGADALAEPAPRSLDQALTGTLALGVANGPSTAFGLTDFGFDQEAHDQELRNLRDEGQLGKELAAICGSSAVISAAALGGNMGSLQTTKTVSQFRLTRRRVDSRLNLREQRFGLNGSIMLAALGEPFQPPISDVSGLEPETPGGFSVFAQGDYESRDRDTTALEAGYEADVSGGLIGVDYTTPGKFVIGAWVGYRKTDATYNTDNNFLAGGMQPSSSIIDPAVLSDMANLNPGGDFDDESVTLGGYAGARFGRGFADLGVQYSHRDYDYRRKVCVIESPSDTDPIEPDSSVESGFSAGGIEVDDIYAGTISGDTSPTEWGVSARMGYDFGSERFLWGPRVSLTYIKSEIDAYTESGKTSVTNTVKSNNEAILTTIREAGDPTGLELAYDEQERTSLQTEAQLVAAYRFEPKFGVIIPRVSASWIHEFKDERELVRVRMAQDHRPDPVRFSFTTDNVDRNKGVIAAGITAFIGARLAADLEVSHLVGDDRYDSTAITAQARWRF